MTVAAERKKPAIPAGNYVRIKKRCQRCGKNYMAHAGPAKWCATCRPIVTREQSRAATQARKRPGVLQSEQWIERKPTEGWYKPDLTTGCAHKLTNAKTGRCRCGTTLNKNKMQKAMPYTSRCAICDRGERHANV